MKIEIVSEIETEENERFEFEIKGLKLAKRQTNQSSVPPSYFLNELEEQHPSFFRE